MASVTLTAEEAAYMVAECAEHTSMLMGCRPPADNIRKAYAKAAPWVELIRELQEELEITQLGPLREKATSLLPLAIEDLESARLGVVAVREGNSGFWVDPDNPPSESRVAQKLDEAIDEVAILRSVLTKIAKAEEAT